MKKLAFLLSISLFISISSCKKDKNSEADTSDETTKENSDITTEYEVTSVSYEDAKVTVQLASKSNSTATGSVIFKQEKGNVSMIALITGLDEGEHAIHLHEKSDCSSDDGKSTGGHWNPTAQPHGKWGDETGFHKGDIGNFTSNSDGHGTITFVTNQWCIGCGDPAKDIIGKAVIVHQGTDDFTSQPSGAAGARISCGGVIQ